MEGSGNGFNVKKTKQNDNNKNMSYVFFYTATKKNVSLSCRVVYPVKGRDKDWGGWRKDALPLLSLSSSSRGKASLLWSFYHPFCSDNLKPSVTSIIFVQEYSGTFFKVFTLFCVGLTLLRAGNVFRLISLKAFRYVRDGMVTAP